jgi:hypothetical protein
MEIILCKSYRNDLEKLHINITFDGLFNWNKYSNFCPLQKHSIHIDVLQENQYLLKVRAASKYREDWETAIQFYKMT